MGSPTKTWAAVTVTCLAIAAAFLVTAGCMKQGNDTAVIPETIAPATSDSPGSVPPAATVPPAGQNLNMTIHSAQKFRMSEGNAPPNNGVWVVVDLSIENRGFPGVFLLNRDAIVLMDPQTGRGYSPES